eukprot:scaffold1938_cov399-Prasinococcus_capsulatus_cf.AAC.5
MLSKCRAIGTSWLVARALAHSIVLSKTTLLEASDLLTLERQNSHVRAHCAVTSFKPEQLASLSRSIDPLRCGLNSNGIPVPIGYGYCSVLMQDALPVPVEQLEVHVVAKRSPGLSSMRHRQTAS